MPDIVAPIIPNIRADPTIFLTAFQQALANRRKQQQLELAVQKLTQQNELAEQRLDLTSRFGEWRHEKDVEALKQTARKIDDLDTHYRAMDDVKSLDEKRKELAWQQKLDSDKQDTNRLIDMQHELYSIESKPGTDDYQKQLNLIKDRYSDVVPTTEGRRALSPVESRHNASAAESIKARKEMRDSFFNRAKGEGMMPYHFANQGMWGKNKDGSRYLGFDTNNQPVKPGDKSAIKFKTLPAKDFDTLSSQYDQIYSSDDQPDTRLKQLDSNKATEFLRQAGGDKQKARQLAREQGYAF